MIQANILLRLSGKTSESFAVMDLMRLPLGILTGVGFIGGDRRHPVADDGDRPVSRWWAN
jgi:hypothetical protein